MLEYDTDDKSMTLFDCDYEFMALDGCSLWECTLKLCDGEHHYMEISPWKFKPST